MLFHEKLFSLANIFITNRNTICCRKKFIFWNSENRFEVVIRHLSMSTEYRFTQIKLIQYLIQYCWCHSFAINWTYIDGNILSSMKIRTHDSWDYKKTFRLIFLIRVFSIGTLNFYCRFYCQFYLRLKMTIETKNSSKAFDCESVFFNSWPRSLFVRTWTNFYQESILSSGRILKSKIKSLLFTFVNSINPLANTSCWLPCWLGDDFEKWFRFL